LIPGLFGREEVAIMVLTLHRHFEKLCYRNSLKTIGSCKLWLSKLQLYFFQKKILFLICSSMAVKCNPKLPKLTTSLFCLYFVGEIKSSLNLLFNPLIKVINSLACPGPMYSYSSRHFEWEAKVFVVDSTMGMIRPVNILAVSWNL